MEGRQSSLKQPSIAYAGGKAINRPAYTNRQKMKKAADQTKGSQPIINLNSQYSYSKSKLCMDVRGRSATSIYRAILQRSVNSQKVILWIESGMTALHTAILEGHVPLTKLLLNDRRLLQMKDEQGYTALHWYFTKHDNLEILKMILREVKGSKIASICDYEEDNILHKAFRIRSTDIIATIFGNVEQTEIVKMLKTRNGLEQVPLDYIFMKSNSETESTSEHTTTCEELLQFVFKNLSPGEWPWVLMSLSGSGQNILEHIIEQGFSEVICTMAEHADNSDSGWLVSSKFGFLLMKFSLSLPKISTERYQIINALYKVLDHVDQAQLSASLMLANKEGDSILHSIMKYQDTDFAILVMRSLSSENRLELLCSLDRQNSPPLHYLLHTLTDSSVRLLSSLLAYIAPTERSQVLSTPDGEGYTIVHRAAQQGSSAVLNAILSLVTDQEAYRLLTMQCNQHQNAIFLSLTNLEALHLLLHSLTNENRIRALQLQGGDEGNTVLHEAVVTGMPQTKAILQSLDSHKDQIHLLSVTNYSDHTVFDYAQSSDVTRYLADVQREREQSVAVCDTPLKDGKQDRRDGRRDRLSRFDNDVIYTPGLDDIIFQKHVTTGKWSGQEARTVYNFEVGDMKSKLKQEAERLLTYQDDFKSFYMTATSLSRAGLISCKKGDEVACLWCEVKFGNFRSTVDAKALHWAYSEKVCEFIINYTQINIPLTPIGKSFLDLAGMAILYQLFYELIF